MEPKLKQLSGWINSLGIIILIIFLLPPIKLPFLGKTTYGLAKILILPFLLLHPRKNLKFGSFHLALLLYFLAINFSIIFAPTTFLSFRDYSTFALFSALFFFSPEIKERTIKKITIFICLFFIFIASIQKFAPSLAKILAGLILQKSDWRLTSFNLARNRVYPLGYPELFLPWLFYFFLKSKNQKKKMFYLALMAGLTLLVVFSGFRWRFLLLILAFVLYIKFNFKIKWQTKFVPVFLFSLLVLLTIILRSAIYQRLALKTKESKNTAASRIKMAQKSVYLWQESPLLGVGFGNWNQTAPLPFDYAGLPLFYSGFETYNETILEIKEGWKNAHNWFFAMLAETGIIGLFATLVLAGTIFILGIKNIHHPAGQSVLLFLFATLFENTHLAIPALTTLLVNSYFIVPVNKIQTQINFKKIH